MINETFEYIQKISLSNNYDKNFLKRLCLFDKIIKGDLPFKTDHGYNSSVSYTRVQHNRWAGPYFGFFNIVSGMTEDEMKTRAFFMTIMLSFFRLPFGGAFGILSLNVKTCKQELNDICKHFVENMSDNIGCTKDIFISDCSDTLVYHYNKICPESWNTFLGKSYFNNGILKRQYCFSFGVSMSILLWYQYFFQIDSMGQRFLFHGLDHRTKWIYQYLVTSLDMNCVGFTHQSNYYHCDHVSFEIISNFLDNPKGKFENILLMPRESFWKSKTEVIIMGDSNEKFSEEILSWMSPKCKLLVEASFGSCGFPFDTRLKDLQIQLIPDIFAMSGEILASAIEYNVNETKEYWNTEIIKNKLIFQYEKAMHDFVRHLKKNGQYTNRHIFYSIGLYRLNKKLEIFG